MKIEKEGQYKTRDGRIAYVSPTGEDIACGWIGDTIFDWKTKNGMIVGSETESEIDLVEYLESERNQPTSKDETQSETAEATLPECNMEVRVTRWTIAPKGHPIYSEHAMTISVDDEFGGEFLTISNAGSDKGLRLDPEEWPILRDAIDAAIKRTCK